MAFRKCAESHLIGFQKTRSGYMEISKMKGYFLLIAIVLSSPIAGIAQNSAAINGKVTYGADGVAVHNATVQIVQTKQTVETGKDGTFEIGGLAPGRYRSEERRVGK